MSYDIDIIDSPSGSGKIQTLQVPVIEKGGTYPVGGTKVATFNITYNYSPYFVMLLGKGGISTLYGQQCEDTIPVLKEAMNRLNSTREECDYWACNQYNVWKALSVLLNMARQLPKGFWAGD